MTLYTKLIGTRKTLAKDPSLRATSWSSNTYKLDTKTSYAGDIAVPRIITLSHFLKYSAKEDGHSQWRSFFAEIINKVLRADVFLIDLSSIKRDPISKITVTVLPTNRHFIIDPATHKNIHKRLREISADVSTVFYFKKCAVNKNNPAQSITVLTRYFDRELAVHHIKQFPQFYNHASDSVRAQFDNYDEKKLKHIHEKKVKEQAQEAKRAKHALTKKRKIDKKVVRAQQKKVSRRLEPGSSPIIGDMQEFTTILRSLIDQKKKSLSGEQLPAPTSIPRTLDEAIYYLARNPKSDHIEIPIAIPTPKQKEKEVLINFSSEQLYCPIHDRNLEQISSIDIMLELGKNGTPMKPHFVRITKDIKATRQAQIPVFALAIFQEDPALKFSKPVATKVVLHKERLHVERQVSSEQPLKLSLRSGII